MQKKALVVTIEFETESYPHSLRALLDHRQRCIDTEPGTLQFEVLEPEGNKNTVILFEVYANAAALNDHNSGHSLALFKEQVGSSIKMASHRSAAVID
ncbi:antibiotic biosynthesis monooxygenase [Ideonella sp. DXS29W]|uniref:Antibiotic biosynthesis monooxygenase n=1 Tax=Ideonella lacteola TaxID=2984193 RepID=A0ABU9C258_9BURK